MKYSFLMMLLSLCLAVGSLLYPEVKWILIWSAVSFAVVASGYAGLGLRVLGKKPSGRISLPHRLLNLPYLAYTALVWHLCRLLSREAAKNVISRDLVIGRRLLSSEAPDGFDHYVDLTAEFDEPAPIRGRPGYLCLPILDVGVPSVEEFRQALERVAVGRTFVHCAQGHGRTGLFTLALLLQRGDVRSIDEGIALLRSLRPEVRLNSTQMSFLRRYVSSYTVDASAAA